MNIYLFEKEKLNLLKDIIHIGDFCLLYDMESLYLWIQDEHHIKDETDLSVTYAQVCSNLQIVCPPNPLIFSYNGVKKRTGNCKDLKSLINSIDNALLQNVLQNALDVLEYKEDRIDIVPLSLLFEQIQKDLIPFPHSIIKEENKEFAEFPILKEPQPNNPTIKPIEQPASQTPETKKIYPPQAYYFYDYLEEKEQNYWQTHYLEDITTRNIYRDIRNINKKEYSKAFNRFLREHPKLSIYSRKENFAPISVSIQPSEETTPIQSLYLLLTKNGYTQFAPNIWKTPDGQCLHINVEETTETPSTDSIGDPTRYVSQDSENASNSTTLNAQKVIDEDKLKATFKHVSSTYKFFWFLAILTFSKKETRNISFKELVARIISLAYPYTEERISFGTTDKIHDTIQCLIFTQTFQPNITNVANETRIIKHFDNERVHKILNQLLLNVPYRFLSPWIPFTTNKEVINQSQDSENKTPYALYPTHIELNEDWQNYFVENYEMLFKYTKTELTKYLRHYNDELRIKRICP